MLPALAMYFPGLIPPAVYDLTDEELDSYLSAIERLKRG